MNLIAALIASLLLTTATIAHANTEQKTIGARSLAKVAVKPRDPTKPPSRKAVRQKRSGEITQPRLVLNSILSSNNRRLAVIDGELLREGDRIGGLRLVRVSPDGVHLRNPNGKPDTVLRLPKVNIAKDYR